MHIENVEAFKVWLTKSLESQCDADPNALAKYIVALLHKNNTPDELRLICLEQLDVFLGDKTRDYVSTIFSELESRSYLLMIPQQSPIDPSMDELMDQVETKDPRQDSEKIESINAVSADSSPYKNSRHLNPRYRNRDSSKPCFEFQNKGRCSRGDKCSYSHIPKDNGLVSMKIGNLPLIPTNDIIKNVMENDVFKQMLKQNQMAYNLAQERSNTESDKNRKRRLNLTALPRSGQNTKKLIVKKVPKNLANVSVILEYFSRFGKVIDVTLFYENEPSSILVEFETSESAKLAYECSDAILGNRFIKVFYHRESSEDLSKKPPQSSDLTYVNPDYLVREEEIKKELSIKQAEFESKRQILLEKIEEETRKILLQLRRIDLDEKTKTELKENLKILMSDKDRLMQHQVDSSKPNIPNENVYHLDKRPSTLSITLNKFSNPTDILSVLNAHKEAPESLDSRVDSIDWYLDSPKASKTVSPSTEN